MRFRVTSKTIRSSLQFFGSPEREGCASLGSSARPRRRARGQAASYQTASSPRKIRLISWGSMSLVSDIKLIRTDTTLDLSQKAEKGMKERWKRKGLYSILGVPENWTMNMGLIKKAIICLRLFACLLSFCKQRLLPVFGFFLLWKGRDWKPLLVFLLLWSSPRQRKNVKAWSGLTVCSLEEGLFFCFRVLPLQKSGISLFLVMQKAKEMRETLAVGDGTFSPPGNEAFISTDLKAWFAFDDEVSAWFHDNLM